jgi:hypothetical protein
LDRFKQLDLKIKDIILEYFVAQYIVSIGAPPTLARK